MRRRLLGAFGAGLLSRLLQFAVAVLLARAIGPEGFGAFVFATGAALVGAQLAGLGWPMLSQKHIAGMRGTGEQRGLRELAGSAELTLLLSACLLAVLLAAVSLSLADTALRSGLLATAGLLPLVAWRKLRRQQLLGLSRPALGLSVDDVLPPTLVLLAVALGLAGGAGSALFAYGAGSMLAVVLGSVVLLRAIGRPRLAPWSRWRSWSGEALPMMLGGLSKVALARADVLLLAPLASLAEVGLYGVAYRLTYLFTFPQVIVGAVYGPRIAAAHARRNWRQRQRLQATAYRFALLSVVPLAIALVWLREPVLGQLFGEPYREAAAVLAVLCLAQTLGALLSLIHI